MQKKNKNRKSCFNFSENLKFFVILVIIACLVAIGVVLIIAAFETKSVKLPTPKKLYWYFS